MTALALAVRYDRLAMPAPASLPADASDEALLAALARGGERRALDTLLARHWGEAYRLAFRSLGDPAAAEDAAQEAFVALSRGASGFEPGKPFGPWFRTLVMNAVRMALRARGRLRRRETEAAARRPEAGPPPSGAGARAALAADVEAHLLRLPEDVRLALVLHVLEGRPQEEVAETIGCPKGTVASRVRRGLERLRESLAGAGYACAAIADAEGALGRLCEAPLDVPAPPSSEAILSLAARAARAALLGKSAAALAGALLLAAAALVPWRAPLPAGAPSGPAAAASSGGAAGGALASAASGGGAGERASGGGLPRAQGPVANGAPGAPSTPLTSSGAGDRAEAARGPGLAVVVRTSDGAPVAGAVVVAAPPDAADGARQVQGPFAAPSAHAVALPGEAPRTDAAGRALLSGLPQGAYVVAARSGLQEGASAPLAFTPSATADVEVVLRSPREPRPGRGAIVGHAIAPDGSPVRIRLARLRVHSEDGDGTGAYGSISSATDGGYALWDLDPGAYEVALDAPGRPAATFKARVAAGEVVEQDVRFEASARITGRIRRADGGRLEGALLGALAEREGGFGAGTSRLEGEVDADAGTYEIEGLLPGRTYRLRADAPGLGRAVRAVRVEEARDVAGPEIVLGLGAVVRGRLVDETGWPIDGAYVVVSRRPLGEGLGAATLAADGSFRIAGVAEGSASLEAHEGGDLQARLAPITGAGIDALAERDLEVPATGEVDLGDIVIAKGAPARASGAGSAFENAPRLVGRVVGPRGEPVPGASVHVKRGPLTQRCGTGADGTFAIRPLGEGPCAVVARTARLVSPAPVEVALADGATSTALVTLVPAGSIAGRVEGAGARRESLRVEARPLVEGARDGAAAVADMIEGSLSSEIAEDGRFAIEGLPPGRYRVLIPEADEGRDVTVAPGAPTALDFRLASGGARIDVRVAGAPQTLFPLKALAYRGTMTARGMEQVLGSAPLVEGEATIAGLPAGPVGVCIFRFDRHPLLLYREGLEAKEGAPLAVEIAWPAKESAATIAGRVEGAPEGASVIAVGESALAQASPSQDGAFRLEGLPPGRYRVVAAAKDERSVPVGGTVVEVAAGGAAEGVAVQAPGR